jgi:VWFA-related protein
VDGRKQVILFSHGFDMMLDDTRLVHEVSSVVQAFRLEDCVLHAVNVAGLSASRAGGQALFTLAHDTGGHSMENSNDLSGQISRIVEATSVVYVLTFRVKLTGQPGRFHTLQVRSHRTGTKIFARAGYLEPKPI